MAISIELWTTDGLVGGAEQWWDDIEAWLPEPEQAQRDYPLVALIDPYGFTTINRDDFPALIEELRRLVAGAPAAVTAVAESLIEVCEIGLGSTAAELRFVGD